MNMLSYPMALKTYVPNSTVKTNIVLHSSFSRTKHTFTSDQKDETCLMKNWNIMLDKYAGHYVVCRNGTVYSCVEEDFWTYHAGVDRRYSDINKKSISIFLTNERYLEKENNKFYAFGFVKPYNMYTGKVFEKSYKGFKYWADYDQAQIQSLALLVKQIAERHDMDLSMLRNTTEFDSQALEKASIISGANLNRDSRSLPLPDWVFELLEANNIPLKG